MAFEELIEEQVDIYTLPHVKPQHIPKIGDQITIGDLHGNAIKLLYFLLKHQIATNLNAKKYAKLVQVYKTPVDSLTREQFNLFNAILDKINFSTECTLRFLGDECADRGSNDYFTLKLFSRLQESHINFEILLSNHGLEFIDGFERTDYFSKPFKNQGIHSSCICSLSNLLHLLHKDFVSSNQLKLLIDTAYKPFLKVLSYTLHQQSITIYTHAAVGLKVVKDFARFFKVKFDNSNNALLATCIDQINGKYQCIINSNKLHRFYNPKKLNLYGICSDLITAPIENITWNRTYDYLDRLIEDIHDPEVESYFINVEIKNAKNVLFDITWGHGHDLNDPLKHHVYSLDNVLGKEKFLNKGKYSAVFFHSVTEDEFDRNPENMPTLENNSENESVYCSII